MITHATSSFLGGGHVSANNIRQHYLRYGGKGTPLVIIPGITSPAITWGFVGERLGRTHDVYILDVRGRGLSSGDPEMDYDIDICARDIISFIECLSLQNCILLGHSMGARFMLRAFSLGIKEVKQAVLLDPPLSGPGRKPYPTALSWYIDSIRKAVIGCNKEDIRAYCPTWTDEQLELRAEWLHTCSEKAIIATYNGFNDDDIHQNFADVSVPTLLVGAQSGGVITDDDVIEIKQLNDSLKFERIKDSGHMIPWDNPDGFYHTLSTFLEVEI